MKGKKTQSKNVRNPLEAVTDFGRDVSDSLKKDLAIGGGKDFLDFLGIGTPSKDGQAESPKSSHEVDIVNFKAKKEKETEEKTPKPESRIEAGIDYHRDVLRSSEQISRQEAQMINNQIQQIISELKSLIGSSHMLQVEFTQIAMEQTTENVGTYHQNFFEWMLNMIRQAKQKVEDSEAWLNVSKGKGNKKGYWNMFKKHGTSFALSSEQSVATQVG